MGVPMHTGARNRMKGTNRQAIGIVVALIVMTIIFYAAWAIWLVDL